MILTISFLNHEANRPEEFEAPKRYSRHCYNLYCVAHSENKEVEFTNLDLLKCVVDFTMKFYPRKWAKYAEEKPGTIKLVPPTYRYKALAEDYVSMSEMMFDSYPSFNEF